MEAFAKQDKVMTIHERQLQKICIADDNLSRIGNKFAYKKCNELRPGRFE